MMNARVTMGTSKYQASKGSLAGSSMSILTSSFRGIYPRLEGADWWEVQKVCRLEQDLNLRSQRECDF